MTTPPDHAAPGPCPISPCDWDLEGTLDEHLYCEHGQEELANALVQIALDNDRLRAQLDAARWPWRRLKTGLIANADKLDVPFTNAPQQSPWTRLKPSMQALDDALKPASTSQEG